MFVCVCVCVWGYWCTLVARPSATELFMTLFISSHWPALCKQIHLCAHTVRLLCLKCLPLPSNFAGLCCRRTPNFDAEFNHWKACQGWCTPIQTFLLKCAQLKHNTLQAGLTFAFDLQASRESVSKYSLRDKGFVIKYTMDVLAFLCTCENTKTQYASSVFAQVLFSCVLLTFFKYASDVTCVG